MFDLILIIRVVSGILKFLEKPHENEKMSPPLEFFAINTKLPIMAM